MSNDMDETHNGADGANGANGEAPEPGAGPALEGLLVIDFTHYIAGPVASMILGDLGAIVVKVENGRRGDDMRRFAPADDRLGGEGAPFLWANRNKRSIALDLKSPRGSAIARDLVQRADVVVENFAANVMQRLGLDYESVRQGNPGLVYCSLSAYGRTGAFSQKSGFDPVVQAESGFMALNGYEDREGVRTGASVMDIATGMMGANVILAALVARGRTGRGQQVGAALFDTAVTMTSYNTTLGLFNDYERKREGNASLDTVPTGVFQASDGPFIIVCGSTAIFQRLFSQVVGRPDIAREAVLQSTGGRRQERARLLVMLETLFATRPRDHWIARLQEAGVPAGMVRTMSEALVSPEMAARGLITQIPHPTAGTVPNVAFPMELDGTPVVAPVAAPMLGQHTAEVLREVLGWDAGQVEAASGEGAFG